MDEITNDESMAEFLVPSLNVDKIKVLDVGANPLDAPPYEDLLEQGYCQLFGFEPQKDAFEQLQKQPQANRKYFNAAVGKGGRQKFNITQHSGFSSLFKIYEPSIRFIGRFQKATRVVEVEELDLVRLDDVDGLSMVDVLKIDVQSAEKNIMETGPRTLSECDFIILEMRYLRLYENEPMFGEMDQFLRECGFMLHRFLPMKSVVINNSQAAKLRPRRAASQLVDGDAIYLRDLTDLAEHTTDRLKKMTIVAACISHSYDLALLLLDELVERNCIAAEVPQSFVEHIPAEFLR